MNEAGEVAAGGFEAVLRDDRDPRRASGETRDAREVRERGRDAAQAPGGLDEGPPRRLGAGRALKEGAVRMGGDALGEERREGISRETDRAERRLGPPGPCRGVREGLKELAAARLVEIPVPGRGRDGAAFEGALGGRDERQSRLGGNGNRAVRGGQSVEAVRDRVGSFEQGRVGALQGVPPPAPPRPGASRGAREFNIRPRNGEFHGSDAFC